MSTSVSDSWRTGKHPVDLGSSFVRALKSRSGGGPPARNKMPTKDFYYFRYNFKPESVDEEKPGILEHRAGTDNGFRLEHPSTQHEDTHVFTEVEQPSSSLNGWECVLIYDEETGAYTLEKLEASLYFKHRPSKGGRRSPNPGTSLARGMDVQLVRQEEEEEEEEEELEQITPPSPVAVPPPAPTPAPKKSQSTKAKAKKPPAVSIPKVEQVPIPKSPSKGKGKGKGSNAPVVLALPQSKPQTREPSPRPDSPPQPPTLRYEGSEDGGSIFPTDGEDDDMEPVNTLPDVEDDQGQEVDEDEFARELEGMMNEEEDTAADKNPPGPVSLNQYAGGVGGYYDTSSSSDESEG